MGPLGTGRTKALATRQYTECCRRRSRLRTSAGRTPESKYFRNDTDQLRVRLEFDPHTTQITHFGLIQGTDRPWRDAFRAALDSTLKDAAGRPIEGLLFPDAGGIMVNHPEGATARIQEIRDSTHGCSASTYGTSTSRLAGRGKT